MMNTTSFSNFDPMGYWTASQQQFQKFAQSYGEQYASFEAQMVARTQQAVAGFAQLAQDAIQYSAQLSTEARKLATQTVTQVATQVSAHVAETTKRATATA